MDAPETEAVPSPEPTSHRRPGKARMSDPSGQTSFRRRLSDNFRIALLTVAVTACYVGLTASALHRGSLLVALGWFAVAVALPVSLLMWLIPETAGRHWVVWLWVPLLCAPFLWFYSR